MAERLSFDAMNLKEELLDGIYAYGYKTPSMIQQRVIVPLCEGHDAIVQAIADPRKIAAFCVGMLQQLDLTTPNCQGLILAPSSVVVQNIADHLRALGRFLPVNVYAFDGQEDILSVGAHVVLGTPMLVLKLLEENKISYDYMQMLVLDEADVLFSHGHAQLSRIVNYPCQRRVQVCVFSEITSKSLIDGTSKMMKNPLELLSNEELSLEGIAKHRFVNVEDQKSKLIALCDLLYNKTGGDGVTPAVVIVFSPTMRDLLTQEMNNKGYTFSATRRCMDQNIRDEVARDFLETGVLITTKREVRGIEFLQQVRSIVITEMRTENEYLKLIGWFRGVTTAISFATQLDWVLLIDLQEEYNVVFDKLGPASQDSLSLRRCRVREKVNVKHVLYKCDGEAVKLSILVNCLQEVFLSVSGSVIFVGDPRTVGGVADFLRKHEYIVFSSNKELREHLAHGNISTHPYVLVTTDMDMDLKMEVPLVINYDLSLTSVQYDNHLGCCANNGVVVHFATKNDWFFVFDIQRMYDVVLTWLPNDILDYLGKATSALKESKAS